MSSNKPRFIPLEYTNSMHDGYRKSFEIEGEFLLLIQHNDRRYLLESICPHAAYPMTDGLIIGNDIRCPMHGYLFDLDSGNCSYYTEGPCRGLKRYDLVENKNHIGVML